MTHVYAYMTPEQQRERDERDLAILSMYDRGMKSREIAREIGVAQSVVQRVIKAIEEHL